MAKVKVWGVALLVVLFACMAFVTLRPSGSAPPMASSYEHPAPLSAQQLEALRNDPDGKPKLTQPKDSWEIHAEAVVTIDPKAFACVSRDMLDEAQRHISKLERTKLDAMFMTMDCVHIPPGERFKILSTEYGVFEFSNVKSDSPNGLWTWNEAVLSHE